MRRALTRFAFAVAVCAAGCFDPVVANGKLQCAPDGTCPDGFDCIAQHCWAHGTSPGGGGDMSASIPGDGGGMLPQCSSGALFCDDFEGDHIAGSGDAQSVAYGATTVWSLDNFGSAGTASIDTVGNNGSAHSLRLDLTLTTAEPRATIAALLAGVPNYAAILKGPFFLRAFVKLSTSPANADNETIGIAAVAFSPDDPDTFFTLGVTPSTLDFNPRPPIVETSHAFTGASADWTQWTCVEWQNVLTDGDGGESYVASFWVADSPAGTFSGTGAPSTFGSVALGPDFQLPAGVASGTFTMWVDDVVISATQVHCN
jgi:hypothetical protein